jgi:glycerophosphoryl diester phosphodiesterase
VSANAPAWLVARPIAHRGLHDAAHGVVENTLGAAEAAIRGGYAIECDVQLSRDGEAMVFHDDALGRLTRARGPVVARTVAELQAVRFRACDERMPTLAQLLERIAGRTPLICELKSRFDGDMRLAERVAALARQYDGPLALKSFDPAPIAHLRARHSAVGPLGVVAEASYRGWHWRRLTAAQKQACAAFLHYPETRPDFLSWRVDDLPHPTPFLLRQLERLPVMTWTVRSPAQRRTASRWADQIVFEDEALARDAARATA